MEFRYLAYWANGDGTERLMHTDVPLFDVDVTSELSGTGVMRAAVAPEFLHERDATGATVLTRWATVIYVELEDQVFDAFILRDIVDEGDVVRLELVGFLGFFAGLPYDTVYNRGDVPSDQVVRELVNHPSRRPGGKLGFRVSFEGSWPRIGNPLPPDIPVIPPVPRNPGKFTDKQPKYPKYPEYPKSSSKAALNSYNAAKKKYDADKKKYDADMKAYYKRQEAHNKLVSEFKNKESERKQKIDERERVYEDAKVKFNWWSTTDLLSEINRLSSELSFEYRVSHWWSGESAVHSVEFARPSFSRRRHDISFVEGENVLVLPKIELSGDKFANEVRMIGRGEGNKTVLEWSQVPAGGKHGLARVLTLTDKSAYRREAMRADTLRALQYFRDPVKFDRFRFVDSELARFGSFRVGDDVLWQSVDRRGVNRDVWVTITEVTVRPDKGECELRVVAVDGLAQGDGGV